MKRTSAAEKLEIIRIVEESGLPIKQTLAESGIALSTFYRWYERYQAEGLDGLVPHKPIPRHCWNRIPDDIREQVVETALEHPEQSPRELACHFTHTRRYFISAPSAYRILK